jgi:hypothetical protein
MIFSQGLAKTQVSSHCVSAFWVFGEQKTPKTP